jgi:hypothetical protein
MSSGFSSLQEAYQSSSKEPDVNRDINRQSYDMHPAYYVHVKPAQHELGLVGGNEVAGIVGNRVDLESDLLGITRPNSWGVAIHHLPPTENLISRNNRKGALQVDATPVPLKTYQQWAYPATVGPEPVKQQVCQRPEKY